MESVSVEEIGLMDAQVVAFPVTDLLSGNRTLVLAQDSSSNAPAEGLTLEDMGLTYVSIPIQIFQDFNQSMSQSSDNSTFLIDSSQLAYLTNGQMMITDDEADAAGISVPTSTACSILSTTADNGKNESIIITTDCGDQQLDDSIIDTQAIASFDGITTTVANDSQFETEKDDKEQAVAIRKEHMYVPGTYIEVLPPIRKGPFKCSICTKEFQMWSAYKKHLKTHLDDKPHRCSQCSASFNVASNLVLHKATHSKDLSCPECNKKFNRQASLKAHLLLHEREESLFCSECGDEFNNQTQLDLHLKEHDEEWVRPEIKVHRCLHCDKQYSKASILKDHMKGHYKMKSSMNSKNKRNSVRNSVVPHHCDICQKSFQKPSQLIRHKRIHTGEKPWKCEIAGCNRAFNQKGSLQIHMLKHNGSRPFQCEFCGAKFSQKGNLRAHVVRLHTIPRSEETAYKCSSCTCIFRKLSRLNAHMNRMHRTPEDEKLWFNMIHQNRGNGLNSQDKENLGELNDYLTVKDSSDKENEDVKNIEGSVQNLFTVASKKEDGTISKHTIRQRIAGPNRWHICSYCGKEFKKPSDLVRHVRIHTHEKPYKCKLCFRAFTVRSTLTTHVRTHTGSKNYWCSFCEKVFATSSSLNVHRKIHFREKRFQCNQCSETFATLNARRMHVACEHSSLKQNSKENEEEGSSVNNNHEQPYVITENGLIQILPVETQLGEQNDPESKETNPDRPHKCTYCEAAYRKSSHLKMHIRTHTGERPFKCDTCGRSFCSSGVLKGHLRTHIGIKTHKCDDCGKFFATKSTLSRHMETHGEGRPFVCLICSKSYKSSTACKNHIRSHDKQQQQQLEAIASDSNTQATIVDIPSASPITEAVTVESMPSEELKGDLVPLISKVVISSTTDVNSSSSITVSSNTADNSSDRVETLLIDHIEPNTFEITDEIEEIGVTEVTQTLHADANGTIMISNLAGPETLSQESIREIEETLNQQLFGSLSTDKEHPENSNVLFDQSFDHCVFSAITLPTEQLSLEPVMTSTSLASILPPDKDNPSLSQSALSKPETDDDNNKEINGLEVHIDSFERSKHSDQLNCSECDKTFLTVAQYKLHEKNHGREKVHECQLCGLNFTTMNSLLRHTVIHSDKKFTCPVCSLVFKTDSQLRRHCNEHQINRRRVKRRRGEARQLTEEETNQLVSQMPQDPSISEEVLIASVAERDKISDLKDPSERFTSEPLHPNQCKYCPKSFRKPSDLTRHLRIHTGERPFTCQCCYKSFSVKSTLDSHMKTHGSLKQFTCHVCGHQFATKGSLKVHMRLHTGSRPFRCPICDQRFRTSGHRKAHLLSHVREANLREISPVHDETSSPTVEEAAIAEIESATTTIATPSITDSGGATEAAVAVLTSVEDQSGSNVNSSTALLDAIFPHIILAEENCETETLIPKIVEVSSLHCKGNLVCTICLKEFGKNSCLIRHMRIHTGERPFKCEVCGKTFNQKNAMLIHLQRHTGEKPWSCPECELCFTQKGNLKTHMRRSHQFSPHTKALLGRSKVPSFSIDLGEKTLDLDKVVGDLFPQMRTSNHTE